MTASAERMRAQRRTMAAPGGFHDRLIKLLGAVLPAGVGVIAAVMVLVPLAPRGEISFLLDRTKVALTGERLRVDDAMYRGQDKQGRPFSVKAGSAVQRSAREPLVQMRSLDARILLNDGPAELTAPGGTYDYDANTVQVGGPVDFRAADGYRMVTSGVAIDIGNKRISGSGGVQGAVPAGTFSADRIFADLNARSVTLDGHARLRMEPGKLRMPR